MQKRRGEGVQGGARGRNVLFGSREARDPTGSVPPKAPTTIPHTPNPTRPGRPAGRLRVFASSRRGAPRTTRRAGAFDGGGTGRGEGLFRQPRHGGLGPGDPQVHGLGPRQGDRPFPAHTVYTAYARYRAHGGGSTVRGLGQRVPANPPTHTHCPAQYDPQHVSTRGPTRHGPPAAAHTRRHSLDSPSDGPFPGGSFFLPVSLSAFLSSCFCLFDLRKKEFSLFHSPAPTCTSIAAHSSILSSCPSPSSGQFHRVCRRSDDPPPGRDGRHERRSCAESCPLCGRQKPPTLRCKGLSPGVSSAARSCALLRTS